LQVLQKIVGFIAAGESAGRGGRVHDFARCAKSSDKEDEGNAGARLNEGRLDFDNWEISRGTQQFG
jgi:hypothetical protein